MTELQTERLLLRGFSLDDAADMFEYAKGPNVGPNAGWEPHESIEVSREIIEQFIEQDNEWAIVWRETGKVIGSMGYHFDCGRRNDSARLLGYCLSEDYWGRGIMTEAVRRVMEHAFIADNCTVLAVRHFTFNDRSRRVIEKCGFRYEGRMRQAFTMYNGEVYDDMCYSILREEFLLDRMALSIK